MRTAGSTSCQGGIGGQLLFGLAFVFAGAALAWMLALPPAVEAFVRRRTGCPTTVGVLYANPFTGRLTARDLVLANPAGFPRRDFLQVRRLEVDVGMRSLLSARRVIDRAAVEIASLTVVRDRAGRVNLRLAEGDLAGSSGGQPPGARPPGGEFLIRHLDVQLDRLVVADYAGSAPEVRTIHLNFRHAYADVTSARQLGAPLAAALGHLAGGLDGLLPAGAGTPPRAGNRLEEAGRRAGAALRHAFESLEKRLGH